MCMYLRSLWIRLQVSLELSSDTGIELKIRRDRARLNVRHDLMPVGLEEREHAVDQHDEVGLEGTEVSAHTHTHTHTRFHTLEINWFFPIVSCSDILTCTLGSCIISLCSRYHNERERERDPSIPFLQAKQ